MVLIASLIMALLVYGLIEYLVHIHNRNSIPVRIHVNGTRGKSSITRLIAAGLRAGGWKVVGKATGTLPRLIDLDGKEIPIIRIGKANVREQLSIFSWAAKRQARAIVIECMAVQPRLQFITEKLMVRATIGIITNVRRDHMDVMGPTLEDVAVSLSTTVPRKGMLLTAEHDPVSLAILQRKCRQRNSGLVEVKDDGISDEEMKGFSYVEHKENVALALDVCSRLGVDRTKALAEMYHARPDPGALRLSRVLNGGKEIVFANALAANDPDSTMGIWQRVLKTKTEWGNIIVLVNARKDRMHRSEQLAELMVKSLPASYYILVGSSTYVIKQKAWRMGLSIDKILDMGGASMPQVVEKLWNLTPQSSMVFAIGNIATIGLELSRYFQGRETIDA